MQLTKKEQKKIYEKRRSGLIKFIVHVDEMKVKPLSGDLDFEIGDTIDHIDNDLRKTYLLVIETQINKFINVKYIFVR
jgi:hypothetical protein